jgi:hypothetical protein
MVPGVDYTVAGNVISFTSDYAPPIHVGGPGVWYFPDRPLYITYSYSPRYGGRIAHMVCSPMYRGKYAVVLDNNFIGEDKYEWMSKEELVNRMKGGGGAWVFVWLVPGPPPVPHNKGS